MCKWIYAASCRRWRHGGRCRETARPADRIPRERADAARLRRRGGPRAAVLAAGRRRRRERRDRAASACLAGARRHAVAAGGRRARRDTRVREFGRLDRPEAALAPGRAPPLPRAWRLYTDDAR